MSNTYTLINRFVSDGALIIRAQQSRTGECVDVLVAPEYRDLACSIWGGADVPVKSIDGCMWLDGGSSVNADMMDALDTRLRNVAARKIAPHATDAQIEDIYDTPMSHSQRIAALRAL